MKRKNYQKPAMSVARMHYTKMLAASVKYDATIDSTLPDYGIPTNLSWD